jgi:thiazole/oxazole-forming peptide maturase SagC family component
MHSHYKNQKLRALPAQIIEIPDGIVVKRGCTEVKITGPGAADAVKMMIGATGTEGASMRDIRRLFASSSGRHLAELIRNLVDRSILVASDGHKDRDDEESNLNIFLWQFGDKAPRSMEQFKTIGVTIIGVNYISRQLVASLMACGHKNFHVIDHPQHRNMRLFDKIGRLRNEQWPAELDRPQDWKEGNNFAVRDCLIATSDFGGQATFCQWNKLCLDQSITFVPVMLKNMIGYVGPVILPGITACYECLLSREQSHIAESVLHRIVDSVAYEGQGIVGFHPSMATILGDIAAFELTRFYSEILPGRKFGKMLEVNLLAAGITQRTVLKVPRCTACSPFIEKASTNLSFTMFSDHPGSQ